MNNLIQDTLQSKKSKRPFFRISKDQAPEQNNKVIKRQAVLLASLIQRVSEK